MIAFPYWLFFFQYAFIMPLSRAVRACYKGCNCLPDIKYVNCSGGNISTPVGKFPYDTEYVDLSWNPLTELPPGSFGALWSLRVLLLKEDNITSVADRAFVGLQSLQKLDLSQNQLSALGEGFSLGLDSLGELSLARNRLVVLESGTFQNLDNLARLDLSYNLVSVVRPRALGSMTALRWLRLDGNRLVALDMGLFSTLHSLEVLRLRGNQINATEPGAFAPLSSLAMLDLRFNRMSAMHFQTLLSIPSSTVHVLLEGNPWHCDCDLQRVFAKLAHVRRLFLDDYHRLRCGDPAELKGDLMAEVDDELCVAETVTVLILTVTVVITVLAAVIMGEKNKKKGNEGPEEKYCPEATEVVGLDSDCDN